MILPCLISCFLSILIIRIYMSLLFIHYERLLSIALRVVTLFSKFLFFIVLAKVLSPKDVGLYGLIVATIGYLVYFLGMEFYCYSTREIAAAKGDEQPKLIGWHFMFLKRTYMVFSPLIIFGVYLYRFPLDISILILTLLVIEHIGQEQNRILISISKPLLANIVLFIRTSLWSIISIPLILIFPCFRSVEFILICWAVGGIGAILVGFYNLPISFCTSSNYTLWLKGGLTVCIPILISTLSLRGVFTVDRYLLAYYNNIEQVAPYVLFMGIANALISILDSGVFAYALPKLIKNAKEKNNKFYSVFSSTLRQTFLTSIIYIGVSVLLIKPLLAWVGKETYGESEIVFYILLFAFLFYSLSMVFHYSLYSLKKDKIIFFCNVIIFPVFLIIHYSLHKLGFLLSVPISVLVVFILSFFIKAIVFFCLYRSLGRKS